MTDTVIKARKTLFRKNSEPVKSWISSLYEVPVFSSAVWMLSLHSKRGMVNQFTKGGGLTPPMCGIGVKNAVILTVRDT